MRENTYWLRNGAAQAKLEAMEAAGFDFTKATQALFRSYYRYHNDGDLPGWARSRWDITRHTSKYGGCQRVLTEAGEAEFERKVTERIELEHARFLRATART